MTARPTTLSSAALGLVLAATVVLVAGCAAPATATHARSSSAHPAPPPPRPPMMRDLALLSVLGDAPGAKVTRVDGIELDDPARSPAAHPVDEGAAITPPYGLWLRPGRHVVHARYVRNIDGGMSLAQGDIAVVLTAGHTYLVHPSVQSDRSRVYFNLADYGTAFPVRCLPWSISVAQQPGVEPKRIRFTPEEITACRQRGP